MPVNNPGGSDHITQLADDAYAESDIPSVYPVGVSIMRVSADWTEYVSSEAAVIFRFRTSSGAAWQNATFDDGTYVYRSWFDDGSEWNEWATFTSLDYYLAHAIHNHDYRYALKYAPLFQATADDEADPESFIFVEGNHWIRLDLDPPEIRAWVDEEIITVAKMSSLLAEVAGTPSEGKVIKYVSGVPTWAAP